MKKFELSQLALLFGPFALYGDCTPACAADDPSLSDVVNSVPAHSSASRWTYDFESSYVFQDIQNPFFLLIGQGGTKNPWHYHLDSYVIGGRYDLTEIGGWHFLRGYWQGMVGVIGADILQGPEHYYYGLTGGLRYLFVPGNGTWTPYFEFRESMGATDASHLFYGQQSDISFMYLLGLGVRIQPDPQWRVSLGLVDQHMSDGYLTKVNYGFDSVGFNVTVEWRHIN